ncbi:MAG TPA: glycosyltransferase family 2 protein [Actinomycetales bacterium]|nr:glycosyltransferase family 2 protein [Actinomycetales bacterium]
MSAPTATSRRRRLHGVVRAATVTAVVLTAHTAVNVRRLRTPTERPAPVTERVSVLLPVRDEAERVGQCLSRLLAQRDVPQLEILVLDDGSTDGTADVVKAPAAGDPRVTLLHGVEPPADWLGKPHACHQLASAAAGSVLVFVDADVLLEPHAVAATVQQLRDLGLDLVSPYPRQEAVTVAERLVQPLLQWSWLTTLPLHLAERSPRPSLTAANGQLLAVDRAAYERAGGHAAVRDEVLDDLALLRAVKQTGGRGTVTDGTALATCRMYTGWADLRDGYTKSLGAGFGSPAGAVAVAGALGVTYVLPAAAALVGSRAGLAGYAAGVLGRVLTARRTGGRDLPDALAHPLSIAVFGYLTLRSLVARRRGTATWKGRPVTSRGAA